MPVKRRNHKPRNTEAIRDAWLDVFEGGSQMFAGTLENLGFDPRDDVQIEAAWREHGHWFLDQRAEMYRVRFRDPGGELRERIRCAVPPGAGRAQHWGALGVAKVWGASVRPREDQASSALPRRQTGSVIAGESGGTSRGTHGFDYLCSDGLTAHKLIL